MWNVLEQCHLCARWIHAFVSGLYMSWICNNCFSMTEANKIYSYICFILVLHEHTKRWTESFSCSKLMEPCDMEHRRLFGDAYLCLSITSHQRRRYIVFWLLIIVPTGGVSTGQLLWGFIWSWLLMPKPSSQWLFPGSHVPVSSTTRARFLPEPFQQAWPNAQLSVDPKCWEQAQHQVSGQGRWPLYPQPEKHWKRSELWPSMVSFIHKTLVALQ